MPVLVQYTYKSALPAETYASDFATERHKEDAKVDVQSTLLFLSSCCDLPFLANTKSDSAVRTVPLCRAWRNGSEAYTL